jgi:hypothetical protein
VEGGGVVRAVVIGAVRGTDEGPPVAVAEVGGDLVAMTALGIV